jgi:hypothetical protein
MPPSIKNNATGMDAQNTAFWNGPIGCGSGLLTPFVRMACDYTEPVIIQIWISSHFGVLSKRPPS